MKKKHLSPPSKTQRTSLEQEVQATGESNDGQPSRNP
jgi:hypothetical protein